MTASVNILEDHLARAEDYVALGAEHIANQKTIVANMESQGLHTTESIRLLTTFEQLQIVRVAHQDRLRAELAEARKAVSNSVTTTGVDD